MAFDLDDPERLMKDEQIVSEQRVPRPQPPAINAVDLFCGAGGLTRGLIDAGINVVAGIDIDPEARHAYEHNNGARFIEKSIEEITPEYVKDLLGPGPSLIAGCAPCQPFSLLTTGKQPDEDPRWALLAEFGRIVKEVQPDFVTMENVPGLSKRPPFEEFTKQLLGAGYTISWDIVDCVDYGVPQHRRRLVLIASLHGDAPMPVATGPRRTARTALMGLRRIEAGGQHAKDAIHRSPKLSPLNLQRIQKSRPGKTWKDWPEELRLRCHQTTKGASYQHAYGRIDPKEPAPTITTKFFNYGSGRFGHYSQDRALSAREAALLQSFPAAYSFETQPGELSLTSLGRLIGNAVPVRLGEAIGDAIHSAWLQANE